MIAIDLVLHDIMDGCGENEFALMFDSGGGDPYIAARHQILEAGVSDEKSLILWLAQALRIRDAQQILTNLGLGFRKSDELGALIVTWLAYRGVNAVKPNVRPVQMAENLTERAQHVSGAPDKNDVSQLMVPNLRLLLRYLAFYFYEQLAHRCESPVSETVERRSDWCSELESASLSRLCEILNVTESIRARPYQTTDCEAIVLGSDAVRDALIALEDASEQSQAPSADANKLFADSVLKLLTVWHREQRLIPKGCAVASYASTPYMQRAECFDEDGRPLRLLDLGPAVAGETFLVSVSEREDVYAPLAAAVPAGHYWAMPPELDSAGWKPLVRDQVFVSYSHKDSRFMKELDTALAPFVASGSIRHWSDRQIQPGSQWRSEIGEGLLRAKVGVLLVSRDFLSSEFIVGEELPPLLAAAESGGLRILWVLVGDCGWKETAIAQFQSVDPAQKPLKGMSPADRDRAWTRTCEQIKSALAK